MSMPRMHRTFSSRRKKVSSASTTGHRGPNLDATKLLTAALAWRLPLHHRPRLSATVKVTVVVDHPVTPS
jgi:hypothetical protein